MLWCLQADPKGPRFQTGFLNIEQLLKVGGMSGLPGLFLLYHTDVTDRQEELPNHFQNQDLLADIFYASLQPKLLHMDLLTGC